MSVVSFSFTLGTNVVSGRIRADVQKDTIEVKFEYMISIIIRG